MLPQIAKLCRRSTSRCQAETLARWNAFVYDSQLQRQRLELAKRRVTSLRLYQAFAAFYDRIKYKVWKRVTLERAAQRLRYRMLVCMDDEDIKQVDDDDIM